MSATKDETLEQAQALTRDWNQKTRVEQIIARHQVWGISDLPNGEYTASFTDVKELLNEREQLRGALRGVAIMLNTELQKYDKEPWAQRVRAALSDQKE